MNDFRPLLLGLWVTALLGLTAPRAEASWYIPRVEFGAGVADATALADYVGFVSRPLPGRSEERTMEYESSATTVLRIAFDLHPELQFGWTRSWRSTSMRFTIDGQELKTGDPNPVTDRPVEVPDFDLTTDLITFRWWPAATRWNGAGPTVTLGAGRIQQKQNGLFVPEDPTFAFDWSADDFALVAGVGLQGEWKVARAGLYFEAVRWRYDAPSENVDGIEETVDIPEEAVLSFEITGRVSIGF